MRALHKGWLRLWVVVTLLAVPAFAEWQFQQWSGEWARLDEMAIRTCVDAEFSRPDHPDALKCGHAAGADKTVFQREGITPLAWWSGALLISLALDLVITCALILVFVAARWVWRGFRLPA